MTETSNFAAQSKQWSVASAKQRPVPTKPLSVASSQFNSHAAPRPVNTVGPKKR